MDIKNIHEQVDATLHSIDAIASAEMPPFFYTRLQARLDKHLAPTWWQLLFASLTKPVFAVVTLSLFVVLNITAITIILKDKQSNTTAESATMQGFAQEYNLSVSTVYNDKTDRK